MVESFYNRPIVNHEELDDLSAVRFFRKLLLADARRLGIPLSAIHAPDAINLADGGIDAGAEYLVRRPRIT